MTQKDGYFADAENTNQNTHMKGNKLFENYPIDAKFWDEMNTEGSVRQHYAAVAKGISQLDAQDLRRKEQLAQELFMNQGITFTVYFENEGIERIFPFDIIVIQNIQFVFRF